MSTLRTIADELGLSVSLVSKVLNGRLGTTGASPETVELICDTAKRLRYTRNAAATALATGRQHVLGVFVHRHGVNGSNVTESLIEGVAQGAGEAGQRLMLRYFRSEEEFRRACREMPANTLDGVVVAGVMHEELVDQLEKMLKRGIGVVTVQDRPMSPRIPAVTCDQERVGRLATEHLISRGCRRIAHVQVTLERFAGYRKALAKAGIEFDPRLVSEDCGFTYMAGAKAAARWLKQGVKFDGIFGQSDQQLTGILPALAAAGLRVPEDVKLVGVDNSPYCEFFPVPLSSVSQEDALRGHIACEMLVQMASGETVVSRQVEPVLFARASSAELPSA